MFSVYSALRDQRESLSSAHVSSVDLRDADGRAVPASLRADLGLDAPAPIPAEDPPRRRLALRWPIYYRAVAQNV